MPTYCEVCGKIATLRWGRFEAALCKSCATALKRIAAKLRLCISSA